MPSAGSNIRSASKKRVYDGDNADPFTLIGVNSSALLPADALKAVLQPAKNQVPGMLAPKRSARKASPGAALSPREAVHAVSGLPSDLSWAQALAAQQAASVQQEPERMGNAYHFNALNEHSSTNTAGTGLPSLSSPRTPRMTRSLATGATGLPSTEASGHGAGSSTYRSYTARTPRSTAGNSSSMAVLHEAEGLGSPLAAASPANGSAALLPRGMPSSGQQAQQVHALSRTPNTASTSIADALPSWMDARSLGQAIEVGRQQHRAAAPAKGSARGRHSSSVPAASNGDASPRLITEAMAGHAGFDIPPLPPLPAEAESKVLAALGPSIAGALYFSAFKILDRDADGVLRPGDVSDIVMASSIPFALEARFIDAHARAGAASGVLGVDFHQFVSLCHTDRRPPHSGGRLTAFAAYLVDHEADIGRILSGYGVTHAELSGYTGLFREPVPPAPVDLAPRPSSRSERQAALRPYVPPPNQVLPELNTELLKPVQPALRIAKATEPSAAPSSPEPDDDFHGEADVFGDSEVLVGDSTDGRRQHRPMAVNSVENTPKRVAGPASALLASLRDQIGAPTPGTPSKAAVRAELMSRAGTRRTMTGSTASSRRSRSTVSTAEHRLVSARGESLSVRVSSAGSGVGAVDVTTAEPAQQQSLPGIPSTTAGVADLAAAVPAMRSSRPGHGSASASVVGDGDVALEGIQMHALEEQASMDSLDSLDDGYDTVSVDRASTAESVASAAAEASTAAPHRAAATSGAVKAPDAPWPPPGVPPLQAKAIKYLFRALRSVRRRRLADAWSDWFDFTVEALRSEFHAAAVTIQAAVRGHLVRSMLREQLQMHLAAHLHMWQTEQASRNGTAQLLPAAAVPAPRVLGSMTGGGGSSMDTTAPLSLQASQPISRGGDDSSYLASPPGELQFSPPGTAGTMMTVMSPPGTAALQSPPGTAAAMSPPGTADPLVREAIVEETARGEALQTAREAIRARSLAAEQYSANLAAQLAEQNAAAEAEIAALRAQIAAIELERAGTAASNATRTNTSVTSNSRTQTPATALKPGSAPEPSRAVSDSAFEDDDEFDYEDVITARQKEVDEQQAQKMRADREVRREASRKRKQQRESQRLAAVAAARAAADALSPPNTAGSVLRPLTVNSDFPVPSTAGSMLRPFSEGSDVPMTAAGSLRMTGLSPAAAELERQRARVQELEAILAQERATAAAAELRLARERAQAAAERQAFEERKAQLQERLAEANAAAAAAAAEAAARAAAEAAAAKTPEELYYAAADGWNEYLDTSTGYYYYVCTAGKNQGVSAWELPALSSVTQPQPDVPSADAHAPGADTSAESSAVEAARAEWKPPPVPSRPVACVECEVLTASRKCQGCDGDTYCTPCFQHIHKRGPKRLHIFWLQLQPADITGDVAVIDATAVVEAAQAEAAAAQLAEQTRKKEEADARARSGGFDGSSGKFQLPSDPDAGPAEVGLLRGRRGSVTAFHKTNAGATWKGAAQAEKARRRAGSQEGSDSDDDFDRVRLRDIGAAARRGSIRLPQPISPNAEADGESASPKAGGGRRRSIVTMPSRVRFSEDADIFSPGVDSAIAKSASEVAGQVQAEVAPLNAKSALRSSLRKKQEGGAGTESLSPTAAPATSSGDAAGGGGITYDATSPRTLAAAAAATSAPPAPEYIAYWNADHQAVYYVELSTMASTWDAPASPPAIIVAGDAAAASALDQPFMVPSFSDSPHSSRNASPAPGASGAGTGLEVDVDAEVVAFQAKLAASSTYTDTMRVLG